MTKLINLLCMILIAFIFNINATEDICKWTSNTGSHFNLKPLMKKEGCDIYLLLYL
jgi:hypothetical protein